MSLLDLPSIPSIDSLTALVPTLPALPALDLSAIPAFPNIPTAPCGLSVAMTGASTLLGTAKNTLASLSLPTGGFAISSLAVLASIKAPFEGMLSQVKAVASGNLIELKSLKSEVMGAVASLKTGGVAAAMTKLHGIQTSFPSFDTAGLISDLQNGTCKICELPNLKILEGLDGAVTLGEQLITPLVDATTTIANAIEPPVITVPEIVFE